MKFNFKCYRIFKDGQSIRTIESTSPEQAIRNHLEIIHESRTEGLTAKWIPYSHQENSKTMSRAMKRRIKARRIAQKIVS